MLSIHHAFFKHIILILTWYEFLIFFYFLPIEKSYPIFLRNSVEINFILELIYLFFIHTYREISFHIYCAIVF